MSRLSRTKLTLVTPGPAPAPYVLWGEYPIPDQLDPDCEVAMGWASQWREQSPPPPGAERRFVRRHRARCPTCNPYSRPWRVWARRLKRRAHTAALPS